MKLRVERPFRTVALATLMALALPLAAAEPTFSAALEECKSCHGERGISRESHTPHLAGQLTAYLVEATGALQKGRWGDSVPDHVPSAYSPAMITELADYFAVQPATDEPEIVDPPVLERGERVYRSRCDGCHEDNGRRTDYRGLGTPRLAAQRSVYIAQQLRDYLAGRRPFRNYVMGRSYTGLTEAEIADVSLFFAAQSSQPPPEVPKATKSKRRKPLQAAPTPQ